jgi:hypothetical protein
MTSPLQTCRGVLGAAGGRRRAEGGVDDRFPVRLHDRRQGDQDGVDDRRAHHPRVGCCTWWNGRSPPSCWLPSWSACSPWLADRRRCCAWITVQSWFLKRCNSFALARSDCPTFRPARETTATSNRSTTGCERSVLNRNHWATLLEARMVIGEFGPWLPHPGRVHYGCRHTHHPVTCEINRIKNKTPRL